MKKYNVNYVKTAIEMAKFVEEKDTLYGNAVFNMLDEFGMMYVLPKMKEKLFRLIQLKKLGKEDHSESFLDSLKDLWGYAFLTILYLEQIQNNDETIDEEEQCLAALIEEAESALNMDEEDETDNCFDSKIEECESLINSYNEAMENLKNDIERINEMCKNAESNSIQMEEIKNPFTINSNGEKEDVDAVHYREVDLLKQMEMLKEEYTEKISALADKVCALKYSDSEEEIEDDEEEDEYSFSGEEYDECKEHQNLDYDGEDINNIKISQLIDKHISRIGMKKMESQMDQFFSGIKPSKDDVCDEVEDEEFDKDVDYCEDDNCCEKEFVCNMIHNENIKRKAEEMKNKYSISNHEVDYIIGIHPWEVENTLREINERYKTCGENIDLKSLRKNMNRLEMQLSHLPSGLVLTPISSNPTLLKRIPISDEIKEYENKTKEAMGNIEQIICNTIDEIIRNNFGK